MAGRSTTPGKSTAALIQYGNAHMQENNIPSLTEAVREFAFNNFVNNVEKVREALQANGVDLYGAEDRRVRSLAILMHDNALFGENGVVQGLVKLSNLTPVDHIRGHPEQNLDAAVILSDYLAGRAEIIAVSYEDVQYTCRDKRGLSARDCDELFDTFRAAPDVYLWLNGVYHAKTPTRWTPISSLVFAAFPGYQVSSAVKSNLLRAKIERDLIIERASATICDTPALYALAVLCRNANRGDYSSSGDRLSAGADDSRDIKVWARLLMSKLFSGEVGRASQTGSESYEHAAVALVYNFSLLRPFLGSRRLRRRGMLFGLFSAVDVEHRFFPGRVSNEIVDEIDVALARNADYYATGRSFVACLRGGPRGMAFYRGVVKREFDDRADAVVGLFREGEVTNGAIGEYEKACAVLEKAVKGIPGQDRIALIEQSERRKDLEWLRYAGLSGSEKVEVVFAPQRPAAIVRGQWLYMYYSKG